MDNDLTYNSQLLRSTYTFDLPETSIATVPAEPRDSSRLLVLRLSERSLEHHTFRDLPSFLPEGTLLVRNNSKVIPARLRVTFENESEGEVFFLTRESKDTGTFFVRPGKKFVEGTKVVLKLSNNTSALVTTEAVLPGGERRLRWHLSAPYEDILDLLEDAGETPLPPYIGAQEDSSSLRDRYQTTYAAEKGSVAAPTAGLHFTPQTFQDLADRQVTITDVTLHVGAGTFLPVKIDDVREHHMHTEWLHVEGSVATTIQKAWDSKQPLLAVGTTSLRVLEHAYRTNLFQAGTDVTSSTDIFIYPPQKVHSATMLLTNFHLPESTLLMLVCAFAGDTNFILEAYKTAVAEGYRFYSFGDAMLILP